MPLVDTIASGYSKSKKRPQLELSYLVSFSDSSLVYKMQ